MLTESAQPLFEGGLWKPVISVKEAKTSEMNPILLPRHREHFESDPRLCLPISDAVRNVSCHPVLNCEFFMSRRISLRPALAQWWDLDCPRGCRLHPRRKQPEGSTSFGAAISRNLQHKSSGGPNQAERAGPILSLIADLSRVNIWLFTFKLCSFHPRLRCGWMVHYMSGARL